MSPGPTPLLDADEVAGEVIRRVAARAPELGDLAQRHLARLTPDRWTIEWYLPSWLGRRLALEPALVAALTRSNVLGLLAIRLEDDIEDGEVPSAEVSGSRALASLTLEMAVAEYRDWFDSTSPIWAFVDRSMADWRAGASGSGLATRGAPVKVAAFACCLHAGRLDRWPMLERSLEDGISALVLYDQFCDWDVDLAAGRWNAFVATITDHQAEELRNGNRSAVLTAMLTSDVVRRHFDRAVGAAMDGAILADRVDVPELTEFLRSWAARTLRQGAETSRHYQSVGNQAMRLMFGTSKEGATG